jgi:hypothetical protein
MARKASGPKKPARGGSRAASRPASAAKRKPPPSAAPGNGESRAARVELARELARARRRIAELERDRERVAEQIDLAIKSIHNVLKMHN